MSWHVRPLQADEAGAVWPLLQRHGWAHRLADANALAALLQASQRACVVLDEQGVPIGFGRAITDGLSNGYLSMLVVDAAWRRRGIGRALVQALMADGAHITWVLRADRPGARAFFEALGFTASSAAMELRRISP